jgi:hypothetical protein
MGPRRSSGAQLVAAGLVAPSLSNRPADHSPAAPRPRPFKPPRKQLADPELNAPSFFVGLMLKGAKLPFPNHGHVVLAHPSPILFYPISSTEVRAGGAAMHSRSRFRVF